MSTTSLMDSKKKWNFYSFKSVADAFDALDDGSNGGKRGDKSLLGTLGALLVVEMHPERRKELMKLMSTAAVESRYGGTVLQEARKLLGLSQPDEEAAIARTAEEEFQRVTGKKGKRKSA